MSNADPIGRDTLHRDVAHTVPSDEMPLDNVLELLTAKARAGDVTALVALLRHHYRSEERAQRDATDELAPRRRRRRSRGRDGRSWRQTKDAVLERDRCVCHICGQPGATTVDHLVPRAFGGSDAPENLAAAHETCNQLRGCGPIPDRAAVMRLASQIAEVTR